MHKKGPVLFATDFSRASAAALKEAIELAKVKKASLVIAHVLVYTGPIFANGVALPSVYAQLESQLHHDATERLESLLQKVRKTGVRATAVMLRGVPHQEIAKLARSRKASWIVVGTHGRTGFSRLVVGSVASRVVAAAPCPVLTVR